MSEYVLRYGHHHVPVFERHPSLREAVLSGLNIDESGDGIAESITGPDGEIVWEHEGHPLDYPGSLDRFAKEHGIAYEHG